MYQHFIGIDIGKFEYVVNCFGQHTTYTFTNDLEGHTRLYGHLSEQLAHSLVVLETTGGYEMELIHFLQQHEVSVHRANTRQVKHFIRSWGQLGKSDAIDARALAAYGQQRHEKLALFKVNPQAKLVALVQRRLELKQLLVQEKNRRQAPDNGYVTSSFERVIEALEEEVTWIDQQLQAGFKSEPKLEEQASILKTIEGIGDISAIYLLILLPELGQVSRRQIASLSGVAPHPRESGTHSGYRFTRGGRPQVKSVLFLAAMTAARSKGKLGEFYRRLVAAGKKKMVALTALMRKLVVIANARIKEWLAAQPPCMN